MKKVTMFVTKTWPYCKVGREFLLKNKIAFEEKDINVDAAAMQVLQRRNVTGVPAFLIGEEMVVGIDQAKILQLVDSRLIECENCQAKLRVPTDKGTVKVTCPKCQHEFSWSAK